MVRLPLVPNGEGVSLTLHCLAQTDSYSTVGYSPKDGVDDLPLLGGVREVLQLHRQKSLADTALPTDYGWRAQCACMPCCIRRLLT